MIADIYVLSCIKKLQRNFRSYRKVKCVNIVKEQDQINEKILENIETFQLNTQTFEKQNFETNNKILNFKGSRDNNGIRNGFGITKWKNGSEYVGTFDMDKASGYGLFRIKDRKEEFKGEFHLDKANGFGIYKHANAKYIGEWSNDYQSGFGTEIWNDRSYYVGEYKKGKKDGIGIYVWNDGSTYEGMWKDNLLHGYVLVFLI